MDFFYDFYRVGYSKFIWSRVGVEMRLFVFYVCGLSLIVRYEVIWVEGFLFWLDRFFFS